MDDTYKTRPMTVDHNLQPNRRFFKPIDENPMEDNDNFEDERPNSPAEQKSTRSGRAIDRCGCTQVLLLNSDQDKTFEEHLNLRCDSVFLEAEAVRKVIKSLEPS